MQRDLVGFHQRATASRSDRRALSFQLGGETVPFTSTAQVPQLPIPLQLIIFDFPL